MIEEESIIYSIKPIINARKTHKDNQLYSLQLNAYQLDCIEGLLDLYNKEKEKNKEINDINFRINYNLLKTAEQLENLKDKIREKIKELEKEYEEYKDSPEWEIFDETKYAYELLQELLEERN